MERTRGKILIVDDNIANLTVGRNLLKSHYDVYLAPTADQMFEILNKISPDLILLDIEMPVIDGYMAISKLKSSERYSGIPVIFLTAQKDEGCEIRGFDLGAADFINKPFSPPLLLKRIEHQLIIAYQNKTIQYHMDNLSALVSEKVSEVITLQNAILDTVSDLVEFRDRYTGGHIARTQLYLKLMIDGLTENGVYSKNTEDWDMDYVLQSAQLHDVGKIAIPDAILNKPARLTRDEFEVMKTHVSVGIDAINRITEKTKSNAFLRHTLKIVGAHHEKWDGTGYPFGLKGEDIPLEGRLMAIADVYDALVSWRPYKAKMPHSEACEIIKESSGTHFDPVLVDVFLKKESLFEQISSDAAQDTLAEWGLTAYTQEMEVGVPQIDTQHRELIERLNNMVSAGSSNITKEDAAVTLDFLGEYVVQHFHDEEQLQKQSAYPKYDSHREQHISFAEEFKKLKAEFLNNGYSSKFTMKLHNSIVTWVSNHIKTSDAEFGKYYHIRTPMIHEIEKQIS